MGETSGYVSAAYLRKSAELAKVLKQRSYELMNIKPGDQLLDVGCGPGIDTIALAKQLDDAGHVFGMDIDKDMLAEADELAEKENLQDRITHQYADVLKIPLDTNQIDAARAERLFQVLPSSVDKEQVVSELLRVIKPGGRLVLADTDWATASVNFENTRMERKLMNFFSETMRPNGYAGRQFFRMLKQRALNNIEIEIFPMVVSDYSQTPFGDWLCGEAIEKNIASEDEMMSWKKSLEKDNEAGEFYGTVNMVMVSAVNV